MLATRSLLPESAKVLHGIFQNLANLKEKYSKSPIPSQGQRKGLQTSRWLLVAGLAFLTSFFFKRWRHQGVLWAVTLRPAHQRWPSSQILPRKSKTRREDWFLILSLSRCWQTWPWVGFLAWLTTFTSSAQLCNTGSCCHSRVQNIRSFCYKMCSYFGISSANKSKMMETLVPTLTSLGELTEQLNMEEQFTVELIEKPEHEETVNLPAFACWRLEINLKVGH